MVRIIDSRVSDSVPSKRFTWRNGSQINEGFKLAKTVYSRSEIKRPQKSLVPIFNSPFYMTPDEPADVTDCDRYPDSPFCFKSPFDSKPIAITANLVKDDCNLGIQINGTFGFVKVPPVQIVYRSPKCSPGEIVERFEDNVIINKQCPYGRQFFQIEKSYDEKRVAEDGKNRTVRIRAEVLEIEIPYRGNHLEPFYSRGELYYVTPDCRVQLKIDYSDDYYLYDVRYVKKYNKIVNAWGLPTSTGAGPTTLWIPESNRDGRGVVVKTTSYTGYLPERNYYYKQSGGKGDYVEIDIKYQYFQVCTGEGWQKPPSIDRRIPPPHFNRDCCMSCCPNVSQNDELLRSLLIKVNKLSNVVGVEEFPASLPKSLITKNNKQPGEVSIPNLTRMLGWFFERFDEIMGEFEIAIDIEDGDLVTKGNQKVEIRLPNVAESIAELTQLALQTTINSELLVNITNRALIETGQNKQQNFKNYMALEALIDYMGFPVSETTEKMPLSFIPGEESFEDMLIETEIDVSVKQFTDKRNLAVVLQDLLQASAIIRAVHWKTLDGNKDIAKQMKEKIKQYKAMKDELNKNADKELTEDLMKDLNN